MIWRGPMLHSVITQFLRSVEWGELDYLVIDLPPGTGDVQLTLIQTVEVTGAVLVTTPSTVALADVRKAIEMFRQVTRGSAGRGGKHEHILLSALREARGHFRARRRGKNRDRVWRACVGGNRD